MARLSMGMSLSGERPMLTGRLPMGTSFTNLFSNIRLSFAMQILLRRLVFFGRAATHPGKPTLGLFLEARDDDSNVINAAAIVGQLDKLLGRGSGICLRLHGTGNFRFGDHTGEAIGTHEKHVA